jgi:hypothetical protein
LIPRPDHRFKLTEFGISYSHYVMAGRTSSQARHISFKFPSNSLLILASYTARPQYKLLFFYFIFFEKGWIGTEYIISEPTSDLLYQPRIMMDDGECGAVGGIIGSGNRSTRRKPAPVRLCPPQIPDYLTRARTRAAAVGRHRLTA